MAQFVEFIANHWMLSGLWVLIFLAILGYQSVASGSVLSPQQATLLVNRGNGVLLDIRERKDFEAGHIVNSVNIPFNKLESRCTELDKHKSDPIIIVCNMGQTASQAVPVLQKAGFSNISRLKGGVNEWRTQGLPLIS